MVRSGHGVERAGGHLDEVLFNQKHFLTIGLKQADIQDINVGQNALIHVDGDIAVLEHLIFFGGAVRLNQTEFRAASAVVDHHDAVVESFFRNLFHLGLSGLGDSNSFFFHLFTSCAGFFFCI